MKPAKLSSVDRGIIAFIVLSFVEFDYLHMIGLGGLMSVLRILAAFCSIAAFVITNAKIDAGLLLWLVLPSWLVLSTVLNGVDISSAVGLSIRILTIALFVSAYSDRLYAVMRILYVMLGILVLANFVSILAFPEGMYVTGTTNMAYENWLLGFKNKHIVFYLPLLLITLLLYEMDGLSLDKIVVVAVIVASSLLTGSSTNLVCMAIMVVLGMLPFFRRRYHVFNASTYGAIIVALFLFIVVFRLQEAFSFLIVDVLGKDLTLTNRTMLWDIALEQIGMRPLLGWGIRDTGYLHLLYNSYSIISPHNQILEYAFQGGLPAVTIYLLINLRIVRTLSRKPTDPFTQVAAAAFLAVHVALLVEVYTDSMFYLLYFTIPLAPSLLSVPAHDKREVTVDARSSRFRRCARV